MSSRSCWLMVRGRPLMYRLASLMVSELGRAYDTCGKRQHNVKALDSLGPGSRENVDASKSKQIHFTAFGHCHMTSKEKLQTAKLAPKINGEIKDIQTCSNETIAKTNQRQAEKK